MSMGAVAKYALAVKRLQDLAAALTKAASGEVLKAANARIQARMEKVVSSKLPPHKDTGLAETIVHVFPDAHGIALKQPRYLRYQGERRAEAIARREAAKAAKAQTDKRSWIVGLLRGKEPEAPKAKARPNWWPFSRGVPPFILNQAAKIYAEELHKLLKP